MLLGKDKEIRFFPSCKNDEMREGKCEQMNQSPKSSEE